MNSSASCLGKGDLQLHCCVRSQPSDHNHHLTISSIQGRCLISGQKPKEEEKNSSEKRQHAAYALGAWSLWTKTGAGCLHVGAERQSRN